MIKIFKQSNTEDFTVKLIKCDSYLARMNVDDRNVLADSHTTTFANGELTVVLEERVRNETMIIVSQPTNYREIFELLSTIDAGRRSSAKEIIAIIPSLPHSRQERRAEGIRTSISAKLFADMLQTAGLDRLITMDVHTTAIEGFYNIPFDNIDPFDLFIEAIEGIELGDYVVVSPDFGGMKRAKKYANKLGRDLAFISKERLKANEVSDMTLIGDVNNKNVVIFDDMIDTGGTLLKAAQLLKDNGANEISVFATHGMFSNDGDVKLMKNGNIKNIFVTNTLLKKNNVTGIFTIDVSKVFNNMLKRVLV